MKYVELTTELGKTTIAVAACRMLSLEEQRTHQNEFQTWVLSVGGKVFLVKEHYDDIVWVLEPKMMAETL